jgi:hypothetical protein
MTTLSASREVVAKRLTCCWFRTVAALSGYIVLSACSGGGGEVHTSFPSPPSDSLKIESQTGSLTDLAAFARDLALHPTPTAGWIKLSGKPGDFVPLPDGEFVQIPGDESDVAPSPLSTSSCTNPNTWNGNSPPNCDNNGAFRRAYSPPVYNEAVATVTLPSTITTMPAGKNPLDGTQATFI